MYVMLKRAYLFPEEKRGHVRSPFFVQRILFPLCNATPVRLPPDINTDRHVAAPRATRLWGAMATVRVCSCHLPVSLLQAPPFPTLWEQELPAQPIWSYSSSPFSVIPSLVSAFPFCFCFPNRRGIATALYLEFKKNNHQQKFCPLC